MLFKGRLRLPDDPGEGIPIDLELEDVFLSLDSGGEDFGEWRLDTVEINRLFSNQFAMQLDGEEMVFIADDALGFAYDGLSTIEDVKGRLSKRRIFKGRKPKKKSVAGHSEQDLDESGESEPEEASTPDVTPDAPMPEVVPFFPESSPSFADSVAESAVDDVGIAPVTPKPIELADAAPDPVVSPPPAAPEMDVQPPPAVAPEPEPTVEQPAALLESAHEVESPALSLDEDAEEELVIEDVSAYGYVPVASASVERQPAVVEQEPAEEDDLVIEEAAPASGAVLREVHSAGEPATGRAHEVHPLGAPSEPAQQVSVEPTVDPSPIDPEPEVASAAETAPLVIERSPVPSPPRGDSSFFEQWSSNGRAPAEPELEPEAEPTATADEETQDTTGPQTQKSGRHARNSGRSRSSVFGRKKSREPEAHEHRYESSKTVGGITRRVCAICGHVSFAGEDVYQEW